jgi:predicted RNA-binding Zn-ribbon protein involved in translation (DUF1610 family)/thymidylate synthase
VTIPLRVNYQLLEYSCPECGMLLKEIAGVLNQDLKESVEECPKCGSILKTLKKIRKQSLPQIQELYDNETNGRSLTVLSRVPLSLPKFQIAHDEFISRLMFDIEPLDTYLHNLNSNENTIAIIGNHNRYDRRLTNILLIRLCVYSLFVRRQNGFISSSRSSLPLLPYVIIVDAGNSLDFYQFVEFMRQYGLDIKETLQRIFVSRAFTVHQLTNLIINELPSIIRQLDTCLVIVPDLLRMFTHDPNIDRKEAKHLIKEIVSAIRKIAISSSSRTRCVTSWNYNHQSSLYNKILLPQFDKCIEVTSFEGNQSPSTLNLRIYNRSSRHYSGTSHCLLQPSDLYFVPQR